MRTTTPCYSGLAVVVTAGLAKAHAGGEVPAEGRRGGRREGGGGTLTSRGKKEASYIFYSFVRWKVRSRETQYLRVPIFGARI